MAETGLVRLVRCPKCQNVLPELENYSVYQCGGCGAVLRANSQNTESGYSSEKPAEEMSLTNLGESGMANVSEATDVEVKSSGGLSKCDGEVLEKNGLVRLDNGNAMVEGTSKVPEIGDGHESVVTEKETNGLNIEDSLRVESRSSPHVSRDSQPMFNYPETEVKAKIALFQDQNMQNNVGNRRFSTSRFPSERASYSKPRSFSYSHEMASQRPNGLDRDRRVQDLENDRAEILKKLEELKDQLTRSCDVAGEPREKAPPVRWTSNLESYEGPNARSPNACSASIGTSTQFLGQEPHAAPYISRRRELFPTSNTNPFSAYAGPSSSRVLRAASGQCHLPQYHPYDRKPALFADSEDFEPFHRREILHQPSCSCHHGYRKNHELFPPSQPAAFHKTQFQDVAKNNFFCHPENPIAFGSQYCNTRSATCALDFHEPQRNIRLPGTLNSGLGGSFGHLPPRVARASNARHERPIAGGAPFVACRNCFELLQLPKKAMCSPKGLQKIQCGTCSTVISFKFVGGKLVLPLQEEANTTLEAEGFDQSQSRMNRGTTNFSSDDFDNSTYEFHAMDRLPVKPSAHDLSPSNSQETDTLPSSSPSMKNDESSPTDPNSNPKPSTLINCPPSLDSPLQEHFDYSSNNQNVNRLGKGNRSSRLDHEKALPSKTTMRQNSLNEASLVTELDVSYNDYNTGGSQDSGDGSKEVDQPQVMKRTGESFLTNIIKKSFKDFTKSNQAAVNGKASVSINGHPMPGGVIKKAEKFAGPIHPGNYWYDARAGFWGVMGGPCLGIIPPSIKEFNYPIPENCAGGNTGVFINGRELHKQDLELLATRGLPTDRNRSYVVEISGRVWDEDSGEELDCLGKLAPTVEKAKHGFGMKVPRTAT